MPSKMEVSYFSPFERTLLAVSTFVMAALSYLLFWGSQISGLERGPTDEAIGTLTLNSRDVRLKSKSSFSWLPAEKNNSLYQFDSIYTGDQSQAVVSLRDGTQIELGADSLVTLVLLQDSLKLDLKYGDLQVEPSLERKILLKNQSSEVELNSESHELSKPRIRVQKHQSQMNTEVQSGKIRIKTAKSTQLVSKGERATLFPKGAIRTQSLSNLPTLSNLPKSAPTKTFIWEPTSKPPPAHTAKIADKPSPQKKPKTQIQPKPVHPLAAPKLKQKHLTLLLEEHKGRTLASIPKPPLSWTPVKGADSYQIELSKNTIFKDAESFSTQRTDYNLDQYNLGQNYFRVRAVRSGKSGPPSDTGTLTATLSRIQLEKISNIVEKSKEAKSLPPVMKIHPRWSNLPLVAHYKVELSESPKFITSQKWTTSTPEHEINIEKPGTYYVRVTPMDRSGTSLQAPSNSIEFQYIFRRPISHPELVDPLDKASVFVQDLSAVYLWLEWGAVPEAKEYEIEISNKRDFSKTLIRKSLSANRFLIQKALPVGKVYWRVRALAMPPNLDSAWSKPYSLDLFNKENQEFVE